MNVNALAPLVFLLMLGACASKPPEAARSVASEPSSARADSSEGAEDNETHSNVVIAEDIRKACGIEASEARFAYDSARVRENDRSILKKLAACFTTGALKGREMRLAGHADPRGDAEYNYLLGQRRADSVKSAIVGVGMRDEKVTTTSRGEIEASGTDEAGWAKDRRVDIVLGT